MQIKKTDIIIFSIRGRAHGLAADLQRRGMTVTLVDLTSQLGVWPAEDQEGPFGFFKTEKYTGTFLERLQEDDHYQSVSNGFTFWLRSGPLEMRGPVTAYRLKKMNLSEELITALSSNGSLGKNLNFKKGLSSSWIFAFSHTFAKTFDLKSVDAKEAQSQLPLTADFYVRFATRQGHERSLRWLSSLGVQVLTKTQVIDLAQKAKSWEGFEFKGDLSGIHRSDYFLWALTSEETAFLDSGLYQKIYQKTKPEESLWSWIRFRGKLSVTAETLKLPQHFVMIDDVDSPWTHDNMIVVQRTGAPDQFDFWIKIPTLQRFNKEYLSKSWNKVEAQMRSRIVDSWPQILSYPQEYYYTHQELGPSPFSIYEKRAWKKISSYQPALNAWVSSPETWESFSWTEQFEVQKKLGENIWNQWKQEQLRKEKKRDREIHPS